MKQLLLISFTILSFFINSCQNSSGPEGTFKVTGKLVLNNYPIDSARVQIDEILNWRTITNNKGEFQINGLSKGTHTFQAHKKLINGETVSINTEIVVGNEDLILGEIQLPTPSMLYPLDSTSISIDGIHLYWSKTSDHDFREYKVYRRTDPGLDENTGELIFVTTSIIDTQYIDNSFYSGLPYYYRVFILSAFGKMGGSNLVSILTPAINYVVNGDFENSSNLVFPDNWIYHPRDDQQEYLSISSDEKYSGNKSLHLSLIDSSLEQFGVHSAWMHQDIETIGFAKNIKYKFSFWAKTLIGRPFIYLVFSDGSMRYFEVPSGGGWKEYSTTFILTENITNIRVHIAVFGEYRENFRIEGWIDKMELKIIL